MFEAVSSCYFRIAARVEAWLDGVPPDLPLPVGDSPLFDTYSVNMEPPPAQAIWSRQGSDPLWWGDRAEHVDRFFRRMTYLGGVEMARDLIASSPDSSDGRQARKQAQMLILASDLEQRVRQVHDPALLSERDRFRGLMLAEYVSSHPAAHTGALGALYRQSNVESPWHFFSYRFVPRPYPILIDGVKTNMRVELLSWREAKERLTPDMHEEFEIPQYAPENRRRPLYVFLGEVAGKPIAVSYNTLERNFSGEVTFDGKRTKKMHSLKGRSSGISMAFLMARLQFLQENGQLKNQPHALVLKGVLPHLIDGWFSVYGIRRHWFFDYFVEDGLTAGEGVQLLGAAAAIAALPQMTPPEYVSPSTLAGWPVEDFQREEAIGVSEAPSEEDQTHRPQGGYPSPWIVTGQTLRVTR